MARTPRPGPAAAAVPTTFRAPAGAVAAARTTPRAAAGLPTQRRQPGPGPRQPGTGQRSAGRPARATAAAARPLGSLVTGGAVHERAGCPRCGEASVTRLALTLPDGAPVTFVSCDTCETRAWFAADGAPLALDTVLTGVPRA